jgi:hypothetical protein
MFHPFESIKTPIIIVLSSYFNIIVQKWDMYFHVLVFLKIYLNVYKNMQSFNIIQWS